jgi:hypothetical protein
MKKFYIPAVALMAMSSSALAWDVTFDRGPSLGQPYNYAGASFRLQVQIAQQNGGVERQCHIYWDDDDGKCTVADFPSTTNALVTVTQTPGGGAHTAIGKIQFWVSVFGDSTVHIPTGQIRFITDQTGNDAAVRIAILPQGLINEGGVLSNRPNSGTAYYGQVVSNCGSNFNLLKEGGSGCPVSFLAGCYSPVFAKPYTGTPTKIWVNRTDDPAASNVMCVTDGEVTDYLINVQ